jgi:hypothetical protein
LVTPAKRGKGKKGIAAPQQPDQTPAERRASMTWAQRLKRVFHIEDPAVINQILAHLAEKAATALLPECRAPPATGLLV